MDFELASTAYFKEQFEKLTNEEKRKIKDRLLLAKQNPYRNKSVHSKRFGRLFRIRMEIQQIECRIVYAVLGKQIFVAGIIDRRHDYSDLENLLDKLAEELAGKK